jgi:hypothetical protein
MPANWRYVQRIAGMARSYVFWGLWVSWPFPTPIVFCRVRAGVTARAA